MGDEGRSEGRELEDGVTGGSGLSRYSSNSDDGCCTTSA